MVNNDVVIFYKNIFGNFYKDKINSLIFSHLYKINFDGVLFIRCSKVFYSDVILSLFLGKLGVSDNLYFLDFSTLLSIYFSDEVMFNDCFFEYNVLILYEMALVDNRLFKNNILKFVLEKRSLNKLKTLVLFDNLNRYELFDSSDSYKVIDLKGVCSAKKCDNF